MTLDLNLIRSHFPALRRPVIYFDNPGGTQITQMALDRMVHYLTLHNANHGGAFATSRESDAVLEMAHQAVADWLNAARPDEIVFGANMTTLTLHLSRSIARTWQPGDTIVVTRLDHDANISPWVLAAQDRGCRVRWVDFHPEDGTLDLDDLARALEEKPRLVAVGYASNALGTINPVAKIVSMAHAVGAWVYVDAVQYAAHGPMDVQALECDFLVCSAYKFFGPHVGVLYGRYDHLQALSAYKVRPAPNDPPGKFETGTQNHEGIAGVLGALEYLEWVGRTFGAAVDQPTLAVYSGRRRTFKQAMLAIQAYEANLSRALLDVLEAIPGVTVYGLRDRARLAERVPTVSFTLAGWLPQAVATALDQAGIYVWDGNFYALAVTERLGLEGKGGLVRVGPVHYNTPDEVQRLGDALARLVRQA
ncbi:cysteine desulfurase-like protein [Thermanaerothrix sp. 4228-RoL]|uniref:Cysteine desulfurase-like protein n=1 Tax=Thermanaerothrix solaris TaxID=3058434 RepID=A0ABU3NNJ9_9CHLR|nr:cysteine desulfurase-like protein [Thermanaerothrix sp. 4228-RoL]MDT8898417.1 cysteine desulfurase-like protein [Thermanaerothrix sp. 4228-RoL]